MSLFSLFFEGAVAIVLILVAGLCWRLDRRLTALRSGQDGVRQTVVELAEATRRAEASVKALRAAGDSAGRDLDEKVAKARALADELSFLMSSDDAPRAHRRASRTPTSMDEPRRTPSSPATRSGGRAGAFAELLERTDASNDVDRLRARLKGVR